MHVNNHVRVDSKHYKPVVNLTVRLYYLRACYLILHSIDPLCHFHNNELLYSRLKLVSLRSLVNAFICMVMYTAYACIYADDRYIPATYAIRVSAKYTVVRKKVPLLFFE